MNRKRILLIDDDRLSRKLIAMALRVAGYEPVQADNGHEAMAILERETTDAILVDLMMPVMDGALFLRWLRGEAKSKVPTVVLSAAATAEVRKTMIEAGASTVIRKPVDFPTLLSTLRALGV